jgi:hypothetical protein
MVDLLSPYRRAGFSVCALRAMGAAVEQAVKGRQRFIAIALLKLDDPRTNRIRPSIGSRR